MSNKSRANARRLEDHGSTAAPAAYEAGGFDIRTKLHRVDVADANIDDAGYESRATVTGDNVITVTVFAQDGTGEVAAGTDLSAATVYYSAYQQ